MVYETVSDSGHGLAEQAVKERLGPLDAQADRAVRAKL